MNSANINGGGDGGGGYGDGTEQAGNDTSHPLPVFFDGRKTFLVFLQLVFLPMRATKERSPGKAMTENKGITASRQRTEG